MSTSALSRLYRTAFVTGASTGLGRAFAEMLLAEGVKVWGTSRQVARLADLGQRFPQDFTAVALELRAGEGVNAIWADADRAAGGFDIVINNAGCGVMAEFAAMPFATWQEQLELMLVQPMRLSHAALRGMLARSATGQKSALVNISSLAAEFPLPFQSAYNVAKAGLSALNESLIVETAGTNVSVIDFRPGDYRTDFDRSMSRVPEGTSAREERAWRAFVAMMRSGPPPVHAAQALRRALWRGRSGTVRTGRFFQAKVAPFLARFGSLSLKRRVQARYFDVS